MKICLIVDDYLPGSIKVGGKMMHELGVEFLKRGHEVSVVTPQPDLKEPYSIAAIGRIDVCLFRCGSVKNVGKVRRAINETLMPHHAWKALRNYFKENPHDLIICYSPSIFWGPLVVKLKKLWNAPGYLILRDFFPQWAIDIKLMRSGSIVAKYLRYFERINYDAADMIGLMSAKNLEWFEKRVQTDKKLEVLYNWAADEPASSDRNYYRLKYGLADQVVFFYGGNIGQAHDMMNIVRLARNIAHETTAHFVLVGRGDEVELVRAAVKEFQLKNITLLPAVSQDEYKSMLAEFDIGLFTLHKEHTTHNFPGKLLGYMLQEKAILGSINPGNDLQSVVENANAGLIAINGDDDAFAASALKLLRDKPLRITMGKNAKQLLHDSFSVETAVNKILHFYDEFKIQNS
jgi:glycosyltransferase involved in cell wall biosynthesis